MSLLVKATGIGKVYPRVHHPRDRLRAFGALLFGQEPADGAEVLKDINLEVHRGQSLALIGSNGAGKSTLLKILTGVIDPSAGQVMTHARTAALLELGAGFQPDFSGMENLRMKATLLGMSAAELDQRLEEILAFADIGDYIHEPVKHYSSGMVVRLGFAVVAASRPELLITDEVLAVGDESFQKKCIRWIDRFLEDGGTLLLVSHSMYLVQKLCQQALWLQDGRISAYGDARAVTQDYLAWHEALERRDLEARRKQAGDHGHYAVREVALLDRNGESCSELATGADLQVRLRLHSPDRRRPVAMVGVVRIDGTPVCGISSQDEKCAVRPLAGDAHGFEAVLKLPALSLLPGQYLIRGHVLDPEGLRLCDTLERGLRISGDEALPGLVRLESEWQ